MRTTENITCPQAINFPVLYSGIWIIEYPVFGDSICYASPALGENYFGLDKNSLLADKLLTNQKLEICIYQNNMSLYSGVLYRDNSHKSWVEKYLVVKLTQIREREDLACDSVFLTFHT